MLRVINGNVSPYVYHYYVYVYYTTPEHRAPMFRDSSTEGSVSHRAET